jgi:hypothetical protein
MANSIRIENPASSSNPTMVPGTPGSWTLPGVCGTAMVNAGAISGISVRICDPGNSASCAASKAATYTKVYEFGGTSVYSWFATDVPVKNATIPPGADNEIWATLSTSTGDVSSSAVALKAVGMIVFATLAHRVHYRRVYRVRFDASTLPPLFNRLAALGMNVSNRVKLFKSGSKWVSDDSAWNMEVNGTSATICAEIDIGIGSPVPVSWTCTDFHAHLGGVFSPQSALIPVNLLVN